MFWLIAILAAAWCVFVLWCCLALARRADNQMDELDQHLQRLRSSQNQEKEPPGQDNLGV
jgi:hypothetical protein